MKIVNAAVGMLYFVPAKDLEILQAQNIIEKQTSSYFESKINKFRN